MVAEVHIYVEGGGNRDDTKTLLRQGFREFFRDLEAIARERNIGWRIVACGSREGAYRAFKIALGANPTAFNILLVDAEEAVERPPWLHLAQRDGRQRATFRQSQGKRKRLRLPASCHAERSEASRPGPFAGAQGDRVQQLRPDQARIVGFGPFAGAQGDRVPTTGQGEYHKIRHGTQLLTRINPAIVRAACPHCERIFTTLSRIMIEEA